MVKLGIGAWLDDDRKDRYTLDRRGRVLLVHSERGQAPQVTDLEGHEPPELKGKWLDYHAVREIEAPVSGYAWPRFHTYRNPGRFAVPYQNDSSSAGGRWFYVSDQGRLLGYEQQSKRWIGSFGPDGFSPPNEQPRDRFQGELYYPTLPFEVGPAAYLSFPGGVYTVDFARRAIRNLYIPAEGQVVLSAIRWKDEKQQPSLVFVFTDKSVHLVDEEGSPVFTVPLAYDPEQYGTLRIGRLADPERFVIWYEPSWHLPAAAIKTMPSYLVEYDPTGREIARRAVPHRPLIGPSSAQVLLGLVTPMAEAAILVGATGDLCSGNGWNGGEEVRLLPFALAEIAQYFIPGVGLDRAKEDSPVFAFRGVILLAAVVCALICYQLARRYAFSRAACIVWALGGLLFGLVGLLLMLSIQEWAARIPCPSCRQPRRVDRDHCEHCGAEHAPPTPDGTEIFEEIAATPHAALVGR
jgi:hypothetical protein